MRSVDALTVEVDQRDRLLDLPACWKGDVHDINTGPWRLWLSDSAARWSVLCLPDQACGGGLIDRYVLKVKRRPTALGVQTIVQNLTIASALSVAALLPTWKPGVHRFKLLAKGVCACKLGCSCSPEAAESFSTRLILTAYVESTGVQRRGWEVCCTC